MSTATSTWALANDEGHFHNSDTWLIIKPAVPDAGMMFAGDHEVDASFSPLAVRLPQHAWRDAKPLVDTYTRGDDLVATYAETELHPLRVQIYWRSLHAAASAKGIELLLSVQTGLLDSDPTVEVVTVLPGDAALQALPVEGSPNDQQRLLVESGSFVASHATMNGTYVEMIHPGDAHRTTIAHEGDRMVVRRKIFEHRLEKGVILRARLRGYFLASSRNVENDNESKIAAECLSEFARSEPPLTT